MAERRMFAKNIVLSDAFLDMPTTTRCLYFTLAMVADDDGFVNSPKSIMRQTGASDDDLKLLFAKRYILGFESGVIVIKHWKIHNIIQKDRYKETTYLEEKSMLTLDGKKAYTEAKKPLDTDCIQNVSKVDTQVSIGKVSIGKDSKGKDIVCVSPTCTHTHEPLVIGKYGNISVDSAWYDSFLDKYGKDYAEFIVDRLSSYKKAKNISNQDDAPYLEQFASQDRGKFNPAKAPSYGDADSFFEAALKRTYEEDDEEIL